MGLNPTPVFRQIENKIKSLVQIPVYVAEIPPDDSLTYDGVTGLMNPFIVLYFGGPIRAAGDHHLNSSRADTTILYVTVECFGARAVDALDIKGLLIDELVDFQGDDFSALILGGSLQYSRSSNTVRPTQYVEAQSFTTRSNLSS